MRTSSEQIVHRVATVTLFTVLFALASWVHVRSAQTRDTLAERRSQVRTLEQLRHACSLGEKPCATQLATVAALFPGERLTCTDLDGALFLTFVADSSDPLAMTHR